MNPSTYTSCPYDDSTHYQQLHHLLLCYRLATSVAVYPTFWRLCTLLTSRVWQPAADTQIWQNEAGDMVGFAMLWRRRPDSPYLVLERIIHPVQAESSLLKAMVAWAVQRAERIVAEQHSSITLVAYGFALSVQDELEVHGFKLSPSDPETYNVYFSLSLQEELPLAVLPAGYSIHRLGVEADIEAYHALYGFAPVTAVHRHELLRSNEYCHLVVANPNGVWVAYCECSVWRAEWEKERVGWIDYVGTQEGNQQRGLGRAILIMALGQLKQWGASVAQLVTISTNLPANKLYRGVGFVETAVSEPPTYEKMISVLN